ncbi:hypothetical protein AB1L30_15985 [Bremerella sp. JC817]|uniref:hypothetical protein n=1 Tax=Bremerella sp. JC817 TaxID=3231756 RepID=UPI003457AAC3
MSDFFGWILDAIFACTNAMIEEAAGLFSWLLKGLWIAFEAIIELIWNTLLSIGQLTLIYLMDQLGIQVDLDFSAFNDVFNWLDTFLPMHEIFTLLRAYTLWQTVVTAFHFAAKFRPF